MAITFYKVPEATVRPGDIVALAPSYRALKEVVHVGQQQASKGQLSARLLGVREPPLDTLRDRLPHS